MQRPWPDAIRWEREPVDRTYRLCEGVYEVLDYWHLAAIVVDAMLGAEYYVKVRIFDISMERADSSMLRSVVGYTLNHCLDGVKLYRYCYTDGKIVVFISYEQEWIVFREVQNRWFR